MATKNVLQYVQSCLSVMDSDNVDAIDETEEAMQVANLLSDVYAELINRQEWRFLHAPITITAAADPANPTQFTIGSDVRRLTNLWYNISESGDVDRRELTFLEPDDFLRRSGTASGDKLLVTAGSQIQFYVYTNRMPTTFTSFDGSVIYADAYKSSVESTLQSSKVSAFGILNPGFTVSDTFIPQLPEHLVPLLQHTLNATAHLYFKQQPSPADEARVLRQLAHARRQESKLTRESYYGKGHGR